MKNIITGILLMLLIGGCNKSDVAIEMDKKMSPSPLIQKIEVLKHEDSFKNYWIGITDEIIKFNHLKEGNVLSLNIYLKERFTTVQECREELFNIGHKLVKDMDEESFIRLFSIYNPTNFKLNSISIHCRKCVNAMNSDIKKNINIEDFILKTRDNNPPDCNCSWSCGDQIASCTLPSCTGSSSDHCCNETSIGCGFLFLGSCDGYDTIDPSNCP